MLFGSIIWLFFVVIMVAECTGPRRPIYGPNSIRYDPGVNWYHHYSQGSLMASAAIDINELAPGNPCHQYLVFLAHGVDLVSLQYPCDSLQPTFGLATQGSVITYFNNVAMRQKSPFDFELIVRFKGGRCYKYEYSLESSSYSPILIATTTKEEIEVSCQYLDQFSLPPMSILSKAPPQMYLPIKGWIHYNKEEKIGFVSIIRCQSKQARGSPSNQEIELETGWCYRVLMLFSGAQKIYEISLSEQPIDDVTSTDKYLRLGKTIYLSLGNIDENGFREFKLLMNFGNDECVQKMLLYDFVHQETREMKPKTLLKDEGNCKELLDGHNEHTSNEQSVRNIKERTFGKTLNTKFGGLQKYGNQREYNIAQCMGFIVQTYINLYTAKEVESVALVGCFEKEAIVLDKVVIEYPNNEINIIMGKKDDKKEKAYYGSYVLFIKKNELEYEVIYRNSIDEMECTKKTFRLSPKSKSRGLFRSKQESSVDKVTFDIKESSSKITLKIVECQDLINNYY